VAARSDILAKTLATNLAAALDPIDPRLAPSIISEYGLDSTATDNTPESLKAVLDLATDICFALGARTFARSWSAEPDAEAFLYHFNVPNPWDGPWKGHATHILDIAFLLQNYREHLPPGQQKTADRFTRHVIGFVNGGSPWPAHQAAQGGVMVYYAQEQGDDDQSRFVENEAPGETGRRVILQTLMKQEWWDKVMEAWELFMKGPK
jgi:carboxylesterase type B